MSKWIEKELSSLCSIEKGDQLNKLALNFAGTYPCINGGVEPSGYTEKYNRPENTISISEGGNSCGYVNLMKEKFWAGGHCYTLQENGKLIDKNFLYFALKYNQERIMQLRVGSGLPNIQRNSLAEYKIRLPEDIEEQKRIAAILSKADELIEATQTLIDKQKKIKTGLMQTLLTCGIDDNGVIRSPKTHKFKDSELGPIPEEWECVELGKILERGKGSMQTGPFGSSLHSNEYVDEGCSVIMPQDILHNEINWIETSHITEDKKTTLKRHIVNEHDVLFARRGDLSKCAVIMSHCDAICGTGCLLLRPNKAELNSLWLKNVYQQTKIQDQVTSMSVGTTMLNINAKILKSLVLAFPSLNEQNRIVSVLQQQDQIIKDLENEKQKYIGIKKGLMADLLTGKVKVPG